VLQGVEQQSAQAPRGELGHLDLSRIAQDLQIRKVQVEAVVGLLDEGNTIPFITRYRKERTSGLDEEVLRTIQERVALLRQLAERKQTILRTIENQGKLTDELRAAILGADNPKRLEDLYLPYKPKKRSLAAAAREKGLEQIAMAVWHAEPGIAETPERLNEVLPTLVNPEQGLNSPDDVLTGVGHILAELIAETADVRAIVRQVLWDTGKLQTTKSEKLAEGQGLEYKDYFNFTEPIRQIPPHRILAINRGEKDNALSAKLDWDAVTGRRVALERLPLPKKDEPRPAEPAPASAETVTPPPEGAAPPAREEPPHGHGHGPHHHHHRGPRGHQPPVNRMEDLQKHPHREFIEKVVDDGLNRLLVPSLEREIRRELTQRAESHAVVVFARNLRSKLLAAPLRGKRVLAIDPAFRTGCKLSALSETGEPLADAVIFPHPPQNKRAEAKSRLEELVRRHQVHVIAIGNGTACRETEELVSELLADLENRRNNPTPPPTPAPPVEAAPPPAAPPAEQPPPLPAEPPAATLETPPLVVEPPPPVAVVETPPPVVEPALAATGEGTVAEAPAPAPEQPQAVEPPPPPKPPVPAEPLPEALPELAYVIVNEAGASVYSASAVGKEEFPQFDATMRSTISIGRRLQDPLSELVKIDPQHVGVGLYQHDVNPRHLKESVESVIESCVNLVGVDLNTASVPLLRYVSGLNQVVARDLVEFRKTHGPFRRRDQLMEVPGIGDARFTQAAGFLKIGGGDEPLDSTWIHPESYAVARQLLAELGYEPGSLSERDKVAELREKLKTLPPEEVAGRLQVGVPTLRDIIEALARPGRDPREDLPPPVFKKGILKLEDLQPGMELKGTVLNVVDFGAFIDIGLKDSGLVHISQMANRYVKSPYDVVAVGDVVSVWVLSVDSQRHRVSLTMIQPGTERRPPERRGPPPRREPREPREQQGEGAPRPPREPREGGPRPPREGGRPPREGGRPPGEARPAGERGERGGDRGGRGGQPREGGRPRTGLPPRGTTRLGGGGQRHQQRRPPGQQPPAPPAGEQQGTPPAEGQQTGGTPAQQQPQQRKPQRRPPAPRLSQEALSGKEPLSTFGELAALFEARTKKPAPPAQAPPPPPAPPAEEPPPAAAAQEQPPAAEQPPPTEAAVPPPVQPEGTPPA
jgi:uncharacterized protein